MNVLHIFHNLQVRLLVSWLAIRYTSQLFSYSIQIIPLLLSSIVMTFIIGLLMKKEREIGVTVENTSMVSIDARAPRIEDDILGNKQHVEIVISNNGVNVNQ